MRPAAPIRLTILTKGLLLVAVPLLLQLVMTGFMIEAGRHEREADALVENAQVALQEAVRLSSRLADAETTGRGYVLTGDPVFSEAYDRAAQDLPRCLSRLNSLKAASVSDKLATDSIAVCMARWLEFQTENVRLVRDGSKDEAAARIATLTGQHLMDDLRQEIADFQWEIERQLQTESDLRDRNHGFFWNVIVIGTILSVLLAVGLAAFFTRKISRRISVLNVNIHSLARGNELLAPIGGNDEIALMDQSFREMAKSLSETQEELKSRSRLLQSMLDNMGDGVVVADETGKFLVFNPAAERIMGMGLIDSPPDEWSDRYHVYLPDQTTVFPPDQLPLVRAIRGEEVHGAELFIRNPNQNNDVWITVTARPLKDESGRLRGGVAVFRDDTLRKRAIREVEYAFQLLDGTRDGIFIFDAETLYFSYVNQGAVEQVGYAREELLQMKVLDIKTDLDETTFRTLIAPVVFGEVVSKTFTANHQHQDGRKIPVEINVQCVVDSTRGRSLVAVARDVTERKQAEAQLIQAREAAESANIAKSEFLAAMSHELRTPLNGILGMNELLLKTELSGKQKQFVQACSTSGKALLHQINDILDLSKIEAGKLELDLHECKLEALVYDVVDVFSHSTQPVVPFQRRYDDVLGSVMTLPKSVHLSCHIDPSACVTVLCDANRVRQVLVNLIGNAVKFTSAGGVTVAVDCVQQVDYQLTLRFSVTDTGIGIPEDRLNRLFSPFSQVDSSTSRKFGGTGLGLSICKQLVELMGGTIGVHSRVGVGSTFWFELTQQFVAEEEFAALQRRMLVGKRVLAIDGIDHARKQIGDSLQAWECPFEQVHSLPEALEAVARADAAGNPFSIVLADCQFIKKEDYVLLQRISKNSCVPIIGLGANPTENEVASASLRKLGIRYVLCDPVRPSALFKSMNSVLAVSNPADASDQPTVPVSDKPLETLSGHLLVAEDNRINQMYIAELLKHCGCTSEIADNGDAALTALELSRFDAVLMDCQMPEMDGFTATREIRRREAAGELPGRLPIIALTANALQGDRERCLEAGMDDYLTKPLNAELLEALLRKLIGSKPETTSAPPCPPQQEQKTKTPRINLTDLLARCLGNFEFALSLLDELESSSGERLEEIRRAADRQDIHATADIAHSLKGVAGTLCATSFQQAAAQVEATARAGNLAEINSQVDNMTRELRQCLDALPTLRQELRAQQMQPSVK